VVVFSGAPVEAADINDILTASLAKPLVRLVQTSAQSLTNSTLTALTFGASSEDVDTHGFHDTGTNTSRVTPTIAGWYRISVTVVFPTTAAVSIIRAAAGKNGTAVAPLTSNKPVAATSTAVTASATALQQANGSTDYFEGLALQTSGGALSTSVAAAGLTSVLEVEYIRGL
jgi:hypothetical protein